MSNERKAMTGRLGALEQIMREIDAAPEHLDAAFMALSFLRTHYAFLREAAQGGVTEAMVERVQEKLNAKLPIEYALTKSEVRAALSAEPAAQGEARSSHRVFRREDWLPCYCAAQADHPIGAEKSEQPAERVPEGWIATRWASDEGMFHLSGPDGVAVDVASSDCSDEGRFLCRLAQSLLAPAAPAEEGDGKEASRSPFCGLCGEVIVSDTVGKRHCACTTGAAR